MISHRDVFYLMSAARSRLLEQPIRARLEGDTKDLTEGECQVLAYYEASLALLRQRGAIQDVEPHVVVFRTPGEPL